MDKKDKKNGEGYSDPTVTKTLENMEDERKFKDLLRVLFYIINRSGFELVNRFELRDKKTGRVFK